MDLAIIGVDGIDARGGFTTYDHAEAMTNAALVERASKAVVVADSSKLGRTGFARICDVAAIETVITDDAATDEQVAESGCGWGERSSCLTLKPKRGAEHE